MVYTIYDIESNGLIRGESFPDVLQFGFIRIDDNLNILSHGTLYFYQSEYYKPLDEESARVHSITLDTLKEHEPDFWKNTATMFALLHDGIVVGKNNHRFDDYVIKHHLNKYRGIESNRTNRTPNIEFKHSIDIEKVLSKYYREWCKSNGIAISSQKRGSLEDYIQMMGLSKEFIDNFANTCGIKFEKNGYHDALYDVLCTYFCLYYALRKGIKLI